MCGGILPAPDREALKRAGVAAFFGPGTDIPAAALEILRLIGEGRRIGAGDAGAERP